LVGFGLLRVNIKNGITNISMKKNNVIMLMLLVGAYIIHNLMCGYISREKTEVVALSLALQVEPPVLEVPM